MAVFRFLFGVGEAGAFPIATRSLSRWMLPTERGALIRRLADLIAERAEALARVEVTDNGNTGDGGGGVAGNWLCRSCLPCRCHLCNHQNCT